MKKLLIIFVIGLSLLLFSYLSYAFVIPPFYELKSRDFSGTFTRSIDPERDILIWPTNETKILRFDIGFSINISEITSTPEPINISVYAGYKLIYHEKNITNVANLTLSESFDRFGGWAFGFESPLHRGPDIFIEIVNMGTKRTSVSGLYTGVGYYREGSFVNAILFFIGIIMTLGSVLQSLNQFVKTTLEKKVRKVEAK